MSSNNVTATTTPTHTALAYKLDYKRRELILNIYTYTHLLCRPSYLLVLFFLFVAETSEKTNRSLYFLSRQSIYK